MANPTVTFNLEQIEITVQCLKTETMRTIIQRFEAKIQQSADSYMYLYSGAQVNLDLTFEEQANHLDRENNQMKILVHKTENNGGNNNQKSRKTLNNNNNDDEFKNKNNLVIYPIDFRIFESTIKFIQFINDNFPHVDILINNAAQTIRRTASYYKYLLPIETKDLTKEEDKKIIKNDFINLQKQLKESESTNKLNNPSQAKKEIQNALISLVDNKSKEYQEILPLSVIASQIRIMEEKSQPHVTVMGGDGQPYDFSKGKNSWNFEFDEIPFQEFTEVQIINTWTPYYLCVKLKPLMMNSPFPDKYIVNVTSVEGIFNHYKRSSHVHTNMAKAALNMFTRTCGSYLKDIGIYMTCVDTGWVSPMNEMNSLLDKDKKNSYENEFVNVPLDELDGAMRVLHPIIEGIKNKNYLYGILLKDYVKSPW